MFVLQYIFENACVRRISSQKSAAQIMPREHSLDLRCHRLDRWVTIAMDADRPAVAFVGLAGFTKLMQAVNSTPDMDSKKRFIAEAGFNKSVSPGLNIINKMDFFGQRNCATPAMPRHAPRVLRRRRGTTTKTTKQKNK